MEEQHNLTPNMNPAVSRSGGHTPGSWSPSDPDGTYHDVIRVYAESRTDIPVCVCPQMHGAGMSVLMGMRNETTEAAHNTRLIAAAPDLLAACRAALELVEGDDPGAGCDSCEEAEAARCRWRESIDQCIRAAIARAEGGAQ